MISKETLEAVKSHILTDEQLEEAIEHYTRLEEDLNCHGDIYKLVWSDVFVTLMMLKRLSEARKKDI